MRRIFLFLVLLVMLAPRDYVAHAHDGDASAGHAYLAASASDHAHHDAGGFDERIDGDSSEPHVHVDTGSHAYALLAPSRPAVARVAAHRPDEPGPALAPDPPPLPLLRPPAAG